MPSDLLCAVQVTVETASVMSPSSVTIGLASFTSVAVDDQPGCGATRTEAIGVGVGNFTCTFTVDAVLLSFGTRKVITWSLPPDVDPGALTVTCADAAAASRSPTVARPAATGPTTAIRRHAPMRFLPSAAPCGALE